MMVFLVSLMSLASMPSAHLDASLFANLDTLSIAPEITAMGRYAVRIIESVVFSF